MQNLPDRSSSGELAEIGPADLEGWSVEDIDAALASLSRRMQRVRMATGLLLWKLRTLLPDGAYGGRVREVAEQLDVAERTLSTWRATAEAAFGLGPPTEAAAKRQRQVALDRQGGERATPVAASATPTAKGKRPPPERAKPDAVLPPPTAPRHEQPTLPGAEGWGRAKSLVASATVLQWAEFDKATLVAVQRRIAEALRLADPSPRRLAPSSVAGVPCPHRKPMRKQVGFGTICDPQAGGCGAKVS